MSVWSTKTARSSSLKQCETAIPVSQPGVPDSGPACGSRLLHAAALTSGPALGRPPRTPQKDQHSDPRSPE